MRSNFWKVLGLSLFMASNASAEAEGECASGFCGTPRDVGGAGAPCTEGDCSGGGGSILIANTDMGETYSTSDDFDNDGFEDDFDNCPFVANRDQADRDGDMVGSSCDNAPVVPNPEQEDIDGDGIGDVDDLDIDGDGLRNSEDNCPNVFNPVQLKTAGAATLGDACNRDDDLDGLSDAEDPCPKLAGVESGAGCDADEDLDGIVDGQDNCPAAANPARHDEDGDGLGDACDDDLDGDGVRNVRDNALSVPNPDQIDLDRDGHGDVDDPELCYVFDRSRPLDCLNPLDTFKVRALLVRGGVSAGDPVNLVLLSNRTDTPMTYSVRVKSRPEGSEVAVKDAIGKVSESRDGFVESMGGFEYDFGTSRPVFVPDVPGTFELEIVATLEGPDALYPGASDVSSHSVQLAVEGDAPSGCRAVRGSDAWFLGCLALGLLRRRRR